MAVLEIKATDEQLVSAVRRGDDRAFEELYGRYQRRVTAYVVGMVKDHGRAEDITQEIFVSALRRMRATDRPIAFKPWIYEIARNACIDAFRRTRRTEEVSFDADEGAVVAREAGLVSSSTPDAAMDAKQRIDDLMGAFGGLSESHHDILVMRELEGLSYQEISERLGISRPSVESTLFRARKRLSEEYDELVSGERCRRVSELLATGTALGARDERRLARHVAHCQPCRRQAYAAGIDTATLTRHKRRESVRRVAALFPLPAFLRFSQAMSPVAEPAAGWTKAVAVAAVLVAGGAGVAAHNGSSSSSPSSAAPAHAAPLVAAPGAAHRHHPALPARKVRVPRSELATTPRARVHHTVATRRSGGVPVKPASGAPTLPSTPVTPSPAHATPPSAGSVGGSGGHKPPAAANTGAPAASAAPSVPAVDNTVHQVTNAATQVSGPVGDVVSGASGGLGH